MNKNFTSLFSKILASLVLVTMLLTMVGTPVVSAQEDPNTPRWNDSTWVQSFVDGKVNAVFSAAHPLPKDPPQQVKEAMAHNAYGVLIEPWRKGCPTNPAQDPNCNVGFVRSYTNWDELYKAVYTAVEANPGHVGPWTDGSVKMSYLREMTSDEMSSADWAQYAMGKVRVNFAENKPLPADDPTNGAVAHLLNEPWRHTCIGLTTDADCNVGKEGTFQDWKDMISYLEEGKWERGSILAMPKSTPAGGNLPNPGAAAAPGQDAPAATPNPGNSLNYIPSPPWQEMWNGMGWAAFCLTPFLLGLLLLAILVGIVVAIVRPRAKAVATARSDEPKG